MRSYQPIVYKITNSGASWALLPANDFTTFQFNRLMQRIWPSTTSSIIKIPYFSTNEGWDVTVDVNNNLHIACTVLGAYSSHMDSLDYNYTFDTEQYDFPRTGPLRHPTIYDFRTLSSGGWHYVVVDSMGTEGPSGILGNPGYNTNVWIDGSGGKLDLSARIQTSKISDGKNARLRRNEPPQHHRMILAALRAGDEPGLRLAVRTDVTQGLRHLAG